jgi:hypothetical protein
MSEHTEQETKPFDREYRWFRPAETEQICADAAEIRGKPGARVEIRYRDGTPYLCFVADHYVSEGTNNSVTCPPFCDH